MESMGYTYDNGMVNIWMSDDKMVSDDLTALDGSPAFLLMKQAYLPAGIVLEQRYLLSCEKAEVRNFRFRQLGV